MSRLVSSRLPRDLPLAVPLPVDDDRAALGPSAQIVRKLSPRRRPRTRISLSTALRSPVRNIQRAPQCAAGCVGRSLAMPATLGRPFPAFPVPSVRMLGTNAGLSRDRRLYAWERTRTVRRRGLCRDVGCRLGRREGTSSFFDYWIMARHLLSV